MTTLSSEELSLSKPGQARAAITEALKQSSSACVTCSFQAEDMVVLRMVQEVVPDVPVLFLDTGYHFPELYAYRDEMAAKYNLNLVNVTPVRTVAEQESEFGLLYQIQPDRCCKLRKVEPLFAALEQYRSLVHRTSTRAIPYAGQPAGSRSLSTADRQATSESEPSRRLERQRSLGFRARERTFPWSRSTTPDTRVSGANLAPRFLSKPATPVRAAGRGASSSAESISQRHTEWRSCSDS